jgi:disulfide oxidoreductase YuzD
MNSQIIVQIIGAPIACEKGVRDSWRDVSHWVAGQLRARFGQAVQVKYYDLFDPDCPALPQEAQLPLVIIEGDVISSGGKISVPSIRNWIEAHGIPRVSERPG